MSGETEASVSGWTTDTLHTHFLRQMSSMRELIDERDVRYEQRYKAQQEGVKEALVSINARLELLNELRGDVATKAEVEALEKLFNNLQIQVERIESTRSGGQANTRAILAAIGGAAAFIGIVSVIANAVFAH